MNEFNGESYPNPMKKFEFEPNFIIAKLEPCAFILATHYHLQNDPSSTNK